MEITRLILEAMGKDESSIEYVKDRLGHDRRYAISNDKITSELGWAPSITFEEEPKLPKWALPNPNIDDWEELAIQEYDQSKDVDIEQIQETEILEQSNSRKAEIIANLKNKTNQ